MARRISRKNGAAWGTGKGLWGNLGGAWLPAKKAWANNGGVWTQVWPPDMAFTSFAVTATTGEIGLTSSLISWAIDTSVPGTVSVQRLAPGGSWTDISTGLTNSGSYTQSPLAPTQGAAGTWTYRAVFIPTWDPSWLVYSATDTVSLTIPVASLTVTATTGEVHFTSSNMTWSTTGTMPGAVKLQRKLGTGGTWTDFATGLARSGSGSYQLAAAGTAQNGTWYYRAVFVPTADATWNILSPEDSATLSYRSKTSLSSWSNNISVWAFERDNEEEPPWRPCGWTLYDDATIKTPNLTDAAIVSSISVKMYTYLVWTVNNPSGWPYTYYTHTAGDPPTDRTAGGYATMTWETDGVGGGYLKKTGTKWSGVLSYYFYENGQPRPFPSTYTNPYGYNLLSKVDIVVAYVDGTSATYSSLSVNGSGNNQVIA